MRKITVLALGIFAVAGLACGGSDGASGPPPNLTGTWQATKVEFTSTGNPSQKVDIIAQGVTVTLVLNAGGTYQETTKTPGQTDEVTTGTWSASVNIFTMTETGLPFSWQFNLSLSGTTLTLSGADSQFDFNSDGIDDPAKLTVVLTR